MELELNKTYTFKIENFQFGDLTSDVLTLMFKDGRICSPFIQMQLQVWFPTLKYVNAAGLTILRLMVRSLNIRVSPRVGVILHPAAWLVVDVRLNLRW